jgi:hypothetical protein
LTAKAKWWKIRREEPMTEKEWLACTEPTPMLEYLDVNCLISDRKQRLFDCACVRRIWHLLLDEKGRKAVEVAERFADGRATIDQLREAQGIVLAAADAQATLHLPGTPNANTVLAAAAGAAWEFRSGADPLRHAAEAIAWQGLTEGGRSELRLARARFAEERKKQAALLREIVVNPFQPFGVSPSTLATNLAQVIYEQSDFDRLPKLADALEKAGCDNAKDLSHCWLPGPHVRGCWVVDAVLRKG